MLNKSLAVGIVFLFIGIAITPGTNTNVVKASANDDLIYVNIEACGIPVTKPQTVKMTKHQSDEILKVFEDIKVKLERVKTREEAIPIYNEAVVLLNNYGLLPKEMSVKEAQNLVTGKFDKPLRKDIFEQSFKQTNGKIKTIINEHIINLCCLVFAFSNNAHIYIGQCPLIHYFLLQIFADIHIFIPACILIQVISNVMSRISPIALFSWLGIIGESNNGGKVEIFSLGLLGLAHNVLVDDALSMFGFSGFKFQFGRINEYEFEHGFLIGYTPIIFDTLI